MPTPAEPRSTVGVVEDDALLRRALQRLLKVSGFSVETFGSAEEFLATEPQSRFDCLVFDIRLGTLTGFDLHERLRAAGVSTPIIFITGHDDDATRERARRVGAAGYLPKPFDEQVLLSTIEGVVAGR
jgi:FixJ family two-component response regulator